MLSGSTTRSRASTYLRCIADRMLLSWYKPLSFHLLHSLAHLFFIRFPRAELGETTSHTGTIHTSGMPIFKTCSSEEEAPGLTIIRKPALLHFRRKKEEKEELHKDEGNGHHSCPHSWPRSSAHIPVAELHQPLLS